MYYEICNRDKFWLSSLLIRLSIGYTQKDMILNLKLNSVQFKFLDEKSSKHTIVHWQHRYRCPLTLRPLKWDGQHFDTLMIFMSSSWASFFITNQGQSIIWKEENIFLIWLYLRNLTHFAKPSAFPIEFLKLMFFPTGVLQKFSCPWKQMAAESCRAL